MSMALKRGLRIIELVSQGPRSYGELTELLDGLNCASLTRLLQVLVAEKYLVKTGAVGMYALGPRATLLGPPDSDATRQILIDSCASLMTEISKARDVTCLLIERVGNKLVNIHRSCTEFSPAMQVVGFGGHGRKSPWFKLVAAYDEAFAQKHYNVEQRAEIAAVRVNGYAFEDGVLRPNHRRLGFPIFNGSSIIAVFGLGGSNQQITDDNLPEIIQRCTTALAELGLST